MRRVAGRAVCVMTGRHALRMAQEIHVAAEELGPEFNPVMGVMAMVLATACDLAEGLMTGEIRMKQRHELKTWPESFAGVVSGEKTFEVRRDDRGFAKGDVLHLLEWKPGTGEYTGQSCERSVTYVLPGGQFGIETGFVVMGLGKVPEAEELWHKSEKACRYCGAFEVEWQSFSDGSDDAHVRCNHCGKRWNEDGCDS